MGWRDFDRLLISDDMPNVIWRDRRRVGRDSGATNFCPLLALIDCGGDHADVRFCLSEMKLTFLQLVTN